MKGDLYCYNKLKGDSKEVNINIETTEGVTAINEAIKFLEEVEPISEKLKFDQELCKLAQRHADDIGKNGLVSHTGTYNLTPTQRAEENDINVDVYENLSFGNYETPSEWILNMLIDDGVKSRTSRENLFRTNIDRIGIGFSSHKVYKYWYVINYWEDYEIEVEEEEEEEESEEEIDKDDNSLNK